MMAAVSIPTIHGASRDSRERLEPVCMDRYPPSSALQRWAVKCTAQRKNVLWGWPTIPHIGQAPEVALYK